MNPRNAIHRNHRSALRIIAFAWLSLVVWFAVGFHAVVEAQTASTSLFEVWFESDVLDEPATGRVLLLLVKVDSDERVGDPLRAPFWTDPQPIFSKTVENLKPGERVRFTGSDTGFPGVLSSLKGEYAVRAVLDVNSTTAGFRLSADNFHSAMTKVNLSSESTTSPHVSPVELALTTQVVPATVESNEHVKLVEFISPRISDFLGFPFTLRAGVVLPPHYHDDDRQNRLYPTVYHVPGFGGSHHSAWWGRKREAAIYTEAVHVYLDSDGPFGHHLYVNSDNNGPVGDALVHELIPHLQDTFRVVDAPEARLLTGHSSGGYSTVSLQVHYPEFFGGCWSTSPDPVDFRAFQMTNIYTNANIFVDDEGNENASFRNNGQAVVMVRQETGMEDALHSRNGSGEQWDSWIGCFSTKSPIDGLPASLWDEETGEINHDVARHWRKHDLRHHITTNWESLGTILSKRLHILVGDADNFDLHRAVILLNDELQQLAGWPDGPQTLDEHALQGYIEVIPGRTHFDIHKGGIGQRIQKEMYRAFESADVLNRTNDK